MFTCPMPESLFLPAGGIQSFAFAEPMHLRLMHGRLWLTIEGMPDDYWMTDGDELALPPNRQIVLEACKDDSTFTLHAATRIAGRAGMFLNAPCTEN